jgi:hypothetical protein
MRLESFLLILLSVFLSATAQLLLKMGVQRVHQPDALSTGLAYAASPRIIAGLRFMGLARWSGSMCSRKSR